MSNTLLCPACGKTFASRKAVPAHVNACKAWPDQISVAPSAFNFDRHFSTGLYAGGLEEGRDYVVCLLCQASGEEVRCARLADHLKHVHGTSVTAYVLTYPEAPTRTEVSVEKRRATTRSTYGVDNVSRSDVAKESTRRTSLERYGVGHASQAAGAKMRRSRTNLQRYGAENPFGSREVQETIRRAHLEKRGVENPSQDSEVMAKRVKTNLERHGTEHYVETEEFREKFKAASRARFGTEHPMQSEEGRELHAQAMQAAHGARNPFLHPEIKKRAYDTNLANHGGKHSQQCADVLAKARATWMEKYGVDNPSKVEEVKARIKEVWLGKYGVPFPPQSLWMNRTQVFPTGPEKVVEALSPECVVYAGDGSYWVRHKGAARARNPDFVVLDRDQTKSYHEGVKLNGLRTSAVIEVFGDYWHGPARTGKQRELHKREVETFYAHAGIVCLVLWESEIKGHPKRVGERILSFLREWGRGDYRDVKEHTAPSVLDLFG